MQDTSDRQAKAPFAARLRSLREIAGLTQEELASRAGLSLNAISALERGQRKRPYPNTVRALADALQLSDEDRSLLLTSVPRRGRETIPEKQAPAPVRSIPRPVTSLIGRDKELIAVSEMVVHPDARLVTLTGPGGAGKTRLALEVARDTARNFSDGTYFVALASLKDPDFVLDEVARSLGISTTEGASVSEALASSLRESDVLIVLDNFEHLLGAATQVSDLLGSCPDITALVTSRSALRVRGERTYPVPPLGLPPERSSRTEDVANSPSAQLFSERARSVSPEFEVTPGNAPEVAAICHSLAGIPLALELAAVKVGFLDTAALLSRLDLALSTSGARDLPERQRTMQTTLDWSCDLLSESERRLLARLSVFSGGFTLDAAEAVGGEGTLEDLRSLVEQSLVQPPRIVSGEARYGMLEPIRQYASRKLEENSETDEARREHAEYFLKMAERFQTVSQIPNVPEWLERCEIEKDNLRGVFSWSIDPSGDASIAVQLAWLLQGFVWNRGYHREARQWAESLIEYDLSGDLRAKALHLAAMTEYLQGEYEIAAIHWTEVEEIGRQEGIALLEGYAHAGIGLIAMSRAEYEAAVSELDRSVAIFDACEDQQMSAATRSWLGNALMATGEHDKAIETFETSLAWGRLVGNLPVCQDLLLSLARVVMLQRDYAKAHDLLREAVELSSKVGDRLKLAQSIESLTVTVSFDEDAEWITTMLGAAARFRKDFDAPGFENLDPDPSLLERTRNEAQKALGEKAFVTAFERGKTMTLDEAIEYALSNDTARSDFRMPSDT